MRARPALVEALDQTAARDATHYGEAEADLASRGLYITTEMDGMQRMLVMHDGRKAHEVRRPCPTIAGPDFVELLVAMEREVHALANPPPTRLERVSAAIDGVRAVGTAARRALGLVREALR